METTYHPELETGQIQSENPLKLIRDRSTTWRLTMEKEEGYRQSDESVRAAPSDDVKNMGLLTIYIKKSDE